MDYVIIRESETLLVKVFSVITIVVYVMISLVSFLVVKLPVILSVLFFCIGVFFAGFSTAYRITKNFKNEKLFILYRWVFWRTKLNLEFPDYISVFHASFVSRNEEDGSESRFKKWVVRFFKDNRFFTILEENDYDIALKKANELSELLEVEIYDRSKE